MNKKNVVHKATLILMPIALVGLILIQYFWIKNAIEDKRETFSHSVAQALGEVSSAVQRNEINKYISRFSDLKKQDSVGKLKKSQIRDLVFVQEDKNTKETFIYKHGILEEDYTVPAMLFDIPSNDSAQIKNYLSKQITKIKKTDGQEKSFSLDADGQSVEDNLGEFNHFDQIMLEDLFREVASKLPIINRINKQQLQKLIQQELKKRGIDLQFQFAVYDQSGGNNMLSNVKSDNFDPKQSRAYKVPLFKSENGETHYELMVFFPDKQNYLIRSVAVISAFAFLFTIIIIWAFIKTLMQLHNQKQISQIKTDFINNMTHEFKTPIATINLALDAMKNPKVTQDTEKLNFYLKMLRDENKRMHAQVENVLRISRLDKNQISIEKEPIDVHELIENAIMHVQLLLDDSQGSIRKHLHAENSDILANELHFTSLLVNILENAIKYSSDAPQIDVYTEVIRNQILIKIKDKGIGMSKNALKKIFKKFYREHTGDLHNVKGHGLGLAYVKRIVEDHQGSIYAESEKGKGSTFFIKIPLII